MNGSNPFRVGSNPTAPARLKREPEGFGWRSAKSHHAVQLCGASPVRGCRGANPRRRQSVSGFDGGCSEPVDTSVCGTEKTGPAPVSHPNAPVAQRQCSRPVSGRCRFEPRPGAPSLIRTALVGARGSDPRRAEFDPLGAYQFGALDQWQDRLHGMQETVGSSPTSSTSFVPFA